MTRMTSFVNDVRIRLQIYLDRRSHRPNSLIILLSKTLTVCTCVFPWTLVKNSYDLNGGVVNLIVRVGNCCVCLYSKQRFRSNPLTVGPSSPPIKLRPTHNNFFFELSQLNISATTTTRWIEHYLDVSSHKSWSWVLETVLCSVQSIYISKCELTYFFLSPNLYCTFRRENSLTGVSKAEKAWRTYSNSLELLWSLQ